VHSCESPKRRFHRTQLYIRRLDHPEMRARIDQSRVLIIPRSNLASLSNRPVTPQKEEKVLGTSRPCLASSARYRVCGNAAHRRVIMVDDDCSQKLAASVLRMGTRTDSANSRATARTHAFRISEKEVPFSRESRESHVRVAR